MATHLETPTAHQLIMSPIGALLSTPLFESVKMSTLRHEFAVLRTGAAARTIEQPSVDAFLAELGTTRDIAPRLRRRIRRALSTYVRLLREAEAANDAWDAAFWAPDATPTPDDLVRLDTERRERTAPVVKPSRIFGFLARNAMVPAVRFDIPSRTAVFSAEAGGLLDADRLYGAPAEIPEVETSRQVAGPDGLEYLIRFPSPAPLMHDVVYARVYEPDRTVGDLPTIIYGSGLGMVYDQIPYWPEEEYMGRALAAEGYRVILPESPWHGRRTPAGYFSGERYLAHAPVSMIELYGAQLQETAVLIQWARAHRAPVVAVAGLSLGGIVAQQVAGRCGTWPEALRPDVVALLATCSHIDQVVLQSDLATHLGLDIAVQRAGWHEDDLRELRPLLDPPAEPGLPPERIYAVLGERDTTVPFAWASALLDTWDVPAANRLVWDTGHFGVLTRVIRHDETRTLLKRALHRVRSAAPASIA